VTLPGDGSCDSAVGGSYGGEVALPGGAVGAPDCKTGSGAAGGSVTLPRSGGGSCGGDVALPSTAGGVTAADCKTGSAAGSRNGGGSYGGDAVPEVAEAVSEFGMPEIE